jgi:hypothetical protein
MHFQTVVVILEVESTFRLSSTLTRWYPMLVRSYVFVHFHVLDRMETWW